MTLPDERYRAVERTKSFLIDLLDPKKTPKVPKNIRLAASSLLKHYPSSYEMEIVADTCPNIFSKDSIWYLNKFKKDDQNENDF